MLKPIPWATPPKPSSVYAVIDSLKERQIRALKYWRDRTQSQSEYIEAVEALLLMGIVE